MRLVDKITKSKYFQKATETEFIKKKMEEVSNTPLLLTVEVQECRGTLAVNIPPPATDRIWCVGAPQGQPATPPSRDHKIPSPFTPDIMESTFSWEEELSNVFRGTLMLVVNPILLSSVSG